MTPAQQHITSLTPSPCHGHDAPGCATCSSFGFLPRRTMASNS
jgi:hypothetical protein